MLGRITDRVSTNPKRTLLVTFIAVVVAAVLGGPIFNALEAGGGFTAEDSDSNQAEVRVERATGSASSAEVIALLDLSAPADSAAGKAAIADVAGELGQVPGITSVADYTTTGDPRFLSTDGDSTYVAATLSDDVDDADLVAAVEDRLGDRDGVLLGGSLVANEQLGEQITEDLGRAEMLAFPLLLLLSIFFFRGARAAVIPVVIGMTTVLTTFLALRGVNEIHELSIFCLNLVIGLGLGLAIDYALFLLTRYREELERHGPGREAIVATMNTAGRTVIYSAATVSLALATLIVFPLNFLQSMGIGGAIVAAIAAIASCILAPAFFAIWNVKLRARGVGDGPDRAHERWDRFARRVMSRPGLIAAVTAVVMVVLTLPALRAVWAPVDIGMVPADLSARQAGDRLAEEFPRQDSNPVLIVAEGGSDDSGAVNELAREVGAVAGIEDVSKPQQLDDSTWQINAVAGGDAAGDDARAAVEDIRAIDAGLPVLVGGSGAEFIDQQASIGEKLPLSIGLLAGFAFLVLWLMTGSVILPLKALVMNALTVGSTLGLLTLVFQDGRLEGLLGYTSDGGIEPTDFLVTATLVFALSTDYGVFLLGRISEAHNAGMSDRDAVATGLGQTGSVVTAAAILLAVAIGAFVTSEVLFIKQIGIGTALGVLIDALIVRSLLVPSLMAMLGHWNWWSPQPLRRLHERLGAGGHEGLAPTTS